MGRWQVGGAEHDLEHAPADQHCRRNRDWPTAIPYDHALAAPEQGSEIGPHQKLAAAHTPPLHSGAAPRPHADRGTWHNKPDDRPQWRGGGKRRGRAGKHAGTLCRQGVGNCTLAAQPGAALSGGRAA